MAHERPPTTREKILTAASDLFMEKGFRDTTVAEICRRADANISAVNYHFGSKEALYQEAWRHSFAQSVKAHPHDGGVADNAPAEERLAGRLRALIERIADENNRDFFISQMEFTNPTGLLAEVMKTELIPQRERNLALMRELLGPEATEQQVMFCETCVIGMCLNPMLMRRVRQRGNSAELPPLIDDLEAFAGHVIRFALAGIAETRERTGKRETP